jgi:hypothetical protein
VRLAIKTTALAFVSAPLVGFAIFTAIALSVAIFARDHRYIDAWSVLFLLGILGVTVILNVEWVEKYRAAPAAHAPSQLREPSPTRALYPLPPPQFPLVLPVPVAMTRPATGAAAPPAVANPYARRL